jgi:predicted nuclease of predicted toxin-antitoxin system
MLSYPVRLAYRLFESGYEAIHTADLPDKNRTTDKDINELSVRGKYVVITKDADFVDSFTLQRKPYKLFLVSTGNIRNTELESLVLKNIDIIEKLFQSHDFIEINRKMVIVHI